MTAVNPKYVNFPWPEDENWRDVPSCAGYQVSDKGRIRTLLRSYPRLLTPEVDKDGYQRVSVSADGARVHKVVHRLVAEAFIGPQPEGMPMCCHRDNDRSNNVPGNLRWDTQKGNIADKKIHGTHQAREKHPRATISQATADEVRRLLNQIPKYRGRLQDISSATGASYQVVAGIAHKGAWK